MNKIFSTFLFSFSFDNYLVISTNLIVETINPHWENNQLYVLKVNNKTNENGDKFDFGKILNDNRTNPYYSFYYEASWLHLSFFL